MATPPPLQNPPNSCLVLGGPLFKILWHFDSTHSVPRVQRRQAAISVFLCWVPLAVLSLAQAHFLGGVKLSFLRDIETHVRFLVSLPMMILAEIVADRRIRPIVKRFLERHVIVPEDLPKFNAAISAARRIHDSATADIVLLVFVYTAGILIWRHQILGGAASWYASPTGAQIHLTMAGYWLALVSVPAFQFVVLRWYMQFLIWFGFLFRVSRLNLHLSTLHPDRAAGLGFVGGSSLVFAPLLFAHSALLSGQIASRVLYNGESLFASKLIFLGYVAFSIAAVLAPLFCFTPHLVHAKRKGIARYGNFASRFVTDFDQKWLKGEANVEPTLAGQDIQSLADLSNSFAVVRGMRFVPIGNHDIALLFVTAIAPFVPLLLTVMPIDELVIHALKIVF